MTRRRPRRGIRAAAVAAAFGLLVTGCAQSGDVATTSAASASQKSVGSAAQSAGQPAGQSADRSAGRSPASLGRTARSAGPEETPSLPPGDPGLDALAVPDPGPAGAAQDPHAEEKAPRAVPVRALLTVDDLRRTYGGRWQQRAGGGDECVVPEGALAERTTSYGGTPAGTVTETVASYGDIRRADAAVLDLRYAAERCGWTGVHDPRIGSAAVAAVDEQGRSMTAVAADGVLVVLVGAGHVATGWKWDALVDLAIGSSCPAAVGGCH